MKNFDPLKTYSSYTFPSASNFTLPASPERPCTGVVLLKFVDLNTSHAMSILLAKWWQLMNIDTFLWRHVNQTNSDFYKIYLGESTYYLHCKITNHCWNLSHILVFSPLSEDTPMYFTLFRCFTQRPHFFPFHENSLVLHWKTSCKELKSGQPTESICLEPPTPF